MPLLAPTCHKIGNATPVGAKTLETGCGQLFLKERDCARVVGRHRRALNEAGGQIRGVNCHASFATARESEAQRVGDVASESRVQSERLFFTFSQRLIRAESPQINPRQGICVAR